MAWQMREYDDQTYRPDSQDETQSDTYYADVGSQIDELYDGPASASSRPTRKAASDAEAKMTPFFTGGGALDSQTTDTQWEASLEFTREQFDVLSSRFQWKNGRFYASEGEPVDVTRAFDPVSPYVTPATPGDTRAQVSPNVLHGEVTVDVVKEELGK
ncbi:hypothetical protein QCA50_005427 [Cerrena zonata]|uniref:Uncharacterized protein n=1 Tax=Cerrena zonata TaxID=2478898 RepID=A0AAW0GQ36_9APHY